MEMRNARIRYKGRLYTEVFLLANRLAKTKASIVCGERNLLTDCFVLRLNASRSRPKQRVKMIFTISFIQLNRSFLDLIDLPS